MATIIVRYAEIGLKGKNRSFFEKQLVENIRQALDPEPTQINREPGQIVLSIDASLVNQTKRKLQKIFGIAWFAKALKANSNLQDIQKASFKTTKNLLSPHTTFAIKATRSDKTLPFTSKTIEETIGDKLRQETQAQVDLNNPDVTLFISVRESKSYVFTEKIPGLGGLPVGSSGKVLSLISGGFDSIASSFALAKRGAQVDFLHFHVFPNKEKVMQTKMPSIRKKLSQYTLSSKVFLASYTPFQMKILDIDKRQEKYELVVFRRLMVKVAEKIAQKHGYQALVLGDSLGQVASQTMENIVTVDKAVEIPIFRPLIGEDKKEVINLVRQIGLEKEATASYKDCCSIISTHPATKANLAKVEQIEQQLQVEQVADKIVKNIQVIGGKLYFDALKMPGKCLE